MGDLRDEAWRLAKRAPMQLQLAYNILLILWGLAFVNILALVYGVAVLARSLAGVDTALSLHPFAGLNSTFFLLGAAAASAVIQPLSKAMHVLRWAEAEEGPRGEDLAARLRKLEAAP